MNTDFICSLFVFQYTIKNFLTSLPQDVYYFENSYCYFNKDLVIALSVVVVATVVFIPLILRFVRLSYKQNMLPDILS